MFLMSEYDDGRHLQAREIQATFSSIFISLEVALHPPLTYEVNILPRQGVVRKINHSINIEELQSNVTFAVKIKAIYQTSTSLFTTFVVTTG